MNSSVELKNEITFDEFKAWMNGLLRGTGKRCPDVDDWNVIYKMMDKVVPDKEEQITFQPYSVPSETVEWFQPPQITDPVPQPIYVGDVVPNPWETTCSSEPWKATCSSDVHGWFTWGESTTKTHTDGTHSHQPDLEGDTGWQEPASLTANTFCTTSTIAPVEAFEPSKSVTQFMEELEDIRKTVQEFTGVKGKKNND